MKTQKHAEKRRKEDKDDKNTILGAVSVREEYSKGIKDDRIEW
jgi:hypothetical protein